MEAHAGELGAIAQHWFEVMRDYGDDVRELLHDGHPIACVGDAAFAYVNAFTAHVNVGFFRGAEIADPDGLLEGTGKFMRHVKLRPERDVGTTALTRPPGDRPLSHEAVGEQADRGETIEQRLDDDLAFQTCQGGAEAMMDAAAERQVEGTCRSRHRVGPGG